MIILDKLFMTFSFFIWMLYTGVAPVGGVTGAAVL